MAIVIKETDLPKIRRQDFDRVVLVRPGEAHGAEITLTPMLPRLHAEHAAARVMPDRTLVVEVAGPHDADVQQRVRIALGLQVSDAEDHGEWLNIRVPDGSREIVARVSREAMEDHFGAGAGPGSLVVAYRAHEAAIHARVRQRAHSGLQYTAAAPLVLKTQDF
jgi:hypothetical protein